MPSNTIAISSAILDEISVQECEYCSKYISKSRCKVDYMKQRNEFECIAHELKPGWVIRYFADNLNSRTVIRAVRRIWVNITWELWYAGVYIGRLEMAESDKLEFCVDTAQETEVVDRYKICSNGIIDELIKLLSK